MLKSNWSEYYSKTIANIKVEGSLKLCITSWLIPSFSIEGIFMKWKFKWFWHEFFSMTNFSFMQKKPLRSSQWKRVKINTAKFFINNLHEVSVLTRYVCCIRLQEIQDLYEAHRQIIVAINTLWKCN